MIVIGKFLLLRYHKNAPSHGLIYEDKGNCIFDTDWVGSPSNVKSISGYYVLIRGNLIPLKEQEAKNVSSSSAKVDCHAMQ